MSTVKQGRVRAGVPEGGRFTSRPRGEPAPLDTGDRDGVDRYVAVRGDREGWQVTPDEMAVLETDPPVHADAMAEWFRDARGDAVDAIEAGGYGRWLIVDETGCRGIDGVDHHAWAEQLADAWQERADLLTGRRGTWPPAA